ncbi:DNA ligase, NAD-dependent [Algoriphagus machipongonensis]|uniref:DNA ligase, NAD-dependent n=1 Tax=Algoriphagus machipongonensis TaxID=388413 RepID=A3I2G7_9BACT|nr:DNA ligase, NAD-dependent [Algoriphagus machipongonensis]EAZ79271.1 DNA ligase, NAD-dependent [Algoriphagus machipongonensis]
MNHQEAAQRIAQLSKEIDHPNQLYYMEDQAVISDFEFNQSRNDLNLLKPTL